MRVASDAAARYVQLVNARALEPLVSLFAADAELLNPLGAHLRGVDEIRAFYRDLVFESPLVLHAVRETATDTDATVELEGRIDGNVVMLLVDLFTVDDRGLITRLALYTRPLAPS